MLSKKWTVRELDSSIRGEQTQTTDPIEDKKTPKSSAGGGGNHIKEEETRLGQILGTKVSVIQQDKKGRGKITIEFYSTEDYERITDVIVQKP